MKYTFKKKDIKNMYRKSCCLFFFTIYPLKKEGITLTCVVPLPSKKGGYFFVTLENWYPWWKGKNTKKSGNSSMVEYCVANAKVEGSNPFFRFIYIKTSWIIYCPIESFFEFFLFVSYPYLQKWFFFLKRSKRYQKKGHSKQNRKLSNILIPSFSKG